MRRPQGSRPPDHCSPAKPSASLAGLSASHILGEAAPMRSPLLPLTTLRNNAGLRGDRAQEYSSVTLRPAISVGRR